MVSIQLPTWEECEIAVDGEFASSLQKFIYNYEPSSPDDKDWRRDLRELLEEIGGG